MVGVFPSLSSGLPLTYSELSPDLGATYKKRCQTATATRAIQKVQKRSMTDDISLFQRRRALTQPELDAIPWLRLLSPADHDRAVSDLRISNANPGEYVCRMGRPVTYWIGVVEGLLKMSTSDATGKTMTFTGVPPSGWFGEGTVLKRETYRYDIQALRKSLVAGLHVDTFHWLLDHSIAFNRFVMNHLNERLGQFIGLREIDRMNNPDVQVARSLAALFNPVLYPDAGSLLRITQQELAYLVGLSRQRVNEALTSLQALGVIRVEYGGLRVLELDALRNAQFAKSPQAVDVRHPPAALT